MSLQVGLGTDVAGGYNPCILSVVRSAVIASRVLEDGTERYRHGGEAPSPAADPEPKDKPVSGRSRRASSADQCATRRMGVYSYGIRGYTTTCLVFDEETTCL